MPPVMLRTFLKPLCLSRSTAFLAPSTGLAVHHVLGVGIELGEVFRKFTQRNERGSGNACDLVFVRLAHIDEGEVVTAVELLF